MLAHKNVNEPVAPPQLSIVPRPALRASVMQDQLARGLKAVTPRPFGKLAKMLPILATVRLEARPDALLLTVTDLELTQTVRIPATGRYSGKPGVSCVDYATMADLAPLLSPERADLEITDYNPITRTVPQLGGDDDAKAQIPHRTHVTEPRLRLRCGANATYFKPSPASEYPAMLRIAPHEVIERTSLEDFATRVKPIKSVKDKDGIFTSGGQTFKLNVGLLYRAWQNLSRFYAAPKTKAERDVWVVPPVFIGTRDDLLWIACGDYAAFITVAE